jgi:hypothetical protein
MAKAGLLDDPGRVVEGNNSLYWMVPGLGILERLSFE